MAASQSPQQARNRVRRKIKANANLGDPGHGTEEISQARRTPSGSSRLLRRWLLAIRLSSLRNWLGLRALLELPRDYFNVAGVVSDGSREQTWCHLTY